MQMIRNRWASLAGFALLLSLLSTPTWAQDKEEVDYKSEACMECHDDIPAFSHKTRHNPAFKVRCEDCHSSTQEHLDDPDASNIVSSGKALQDRCLTCHKQATEGSHFQANKHGNKVLCVDCHQAHASEKPTRHLLKAQGTDACLSCHPNVRASFAKPYGHRLSHGGLDCNSCHDIHATANTKYRGPNFDREAQCLSCHQEKQGPFVFEHVTGLAGDCTSCHEPHSSTNAMQLKRATVQQLCLECHSSQRSLSSLGSQPPAIHDLRSPRYRNCTTCHTAVPGSPTSPMVLK